MSKREKIGHFVEESLNLTTRNNTDHNSATKARLRELFRQIEKEFDLLLEENDELRKRVDELEKSSPSAAGSDKPAVTATASTSTAASQQPTTATASTNTGQTPSSAAQGLGAGVISSKKKPRPSIHEHFKDFQSKFIKGLKGPKGEDDIIRYFRYHKDVVWGVQTAPCYNGSAADAGMLAGASADHTVSLWSEDMLNPLYVYKGHIGSVNALRFHATQPLLCTVSGDNTCKIWKVPIVQTYQQPQQQPITTSALLSKSPPITVTTPMKTAPANQSQSSRSHVDGNRQRLIGGAIEIPDRPIGPLRDLVLADIDNVDPNTESIRATQTDSQDMLTDVADMADFDDLQSDPLTGAIAQPTLTEEYSNDPAYYGLDECNLDHELSNPDIEPVHHSHSDSAVDQQHHQQRGQLSSSPQQQHVRSNSSQSGGVAATTPQQKRLSRQFDVEAESNETRFITKCELDISGQHSTAISGCDWWSDSTVITAAWDGIVRLFSIADGSYRLRSEFQAHVGPVSDVRCSSMNGTLLMTASKDGTARLWDLRNSTSAAYVHTFKSHSDPINTAVITANERTIVTGCDDGAIKLYDVRNLKSSMKTISTNSGVNRISLSPNQMYFSAALDKRAAVIYDIQNGSHVHTLHSSKKGHKLMVCGSSWSNDNDCVYTSSADGTIIQWQAFPQ